MALIGPTAADIRDVMIEGESGIKSIAPPWCRPEYKPSLRRVEWPNGAIAITYSAEDPDQLRGPNVDGAWCDELAAWKYQQEAWDMLMFTLRAGNDPRAVVTTTPRPTKLVKELARDATTYVTHGSTYDNKANLAPKFFQHVVSKYEGTRLGRQELNAEILDDNPGALWKREQIEAGRVTQHPPLVRIAVAIDPAVTANEGSDETGIIVGGVGEDGHGYILDDKSLRGRPHEWARAAVTAYHTHRADRIFAEVNNGGDLVEATIRIIDPSIPYTAVHASRGKVTRAEPVAALYERGRVHHVGTFPDLEDQLCSWEQGMSSPDRLDALVWLLTELMVTRRGIPFADEIDATLMASARDAAQEHQEHGAQEQEPATRPAVTPTPSTDATPSTGVDPFAWADAHL